ncbi:MAG: DNA repair protein RadC [Nitrospinota bacterium]
MTGGRRPIKHWPSAERPRERLIERGPEALSDAQLLAILLRTGDTSQSALDLALSLLARFGSLAGLATASVAELCEMKGIGPAKAAQVKAGIELSRRLGASEGAARPAFHGGGDIFRHLGPAMSALPHEEFRLLLLDTKHRLNRELTISRGTLAGTAVDPREVFSAALRERAAAVVCAHNHPSGDPAPSPEDRALTARLRQSGQLVGVPLLDHVIVGRGAFFSFAEAGWPS